MKANLSAIVILTAALTLGLVYSQNSATVTKPGCCDCCDVGCYCCVTGACNCANCNCSCDCCGATGCCAKSAEKVAVTTKPAKACCSSGNCCK